MYRIAIHILVVSIAASIAACSSPEPSQESASPEPLEQCEDDCVDKARECGRPDPSVCPDLCSYGVDLSCVDDLECPAFHEGLANGTPCASANDSGSEPSSGGSSCPAEPTCTEDATAVVSCEDVGGTPTPMTRRCDEGHCVDGTCGACESRSDCVTVDICSCADGENVATDVDKDCVGGRCMALAAPDCELACEDHGGAG